MYNIVQADIGPLKVVELKGVHGHFVIVTIYCTGGRRDRPQIHIIAYCLTTGDTYDVEKSRIINVLDLELTQTQMASALNLCGDFAVLDTEHKRLPKYSKPKTRQCLSATKTAGAEVNKPARGAKIRARRKLRAERERQAKEEQKKTEQDEQLRKKKVQQKKTEQKKTEQKKKELLLHQRKLAKRANREAKREAKREAERSQALREAEEWRAKELALETEISKLRKSLLREKPAATPEEPQVSHREKELKAQATRIAKLEAEISRLSEAPDRGRKRVRAGKQALGPRKKDKKKRRNISTVRKPSSDSLEPVKEQHRGGCPGDSLAALEDPHVRLFLDNKLLQWQITKHNERKAKKFARKRRRLVQEYELEREEDEDIL
jgi:hypothetical protein